jgi:hypothetical protein
MCHYQQLQYTECDCGNDIHITKSKCSYAEANGSTGSAGGLFGRRFLRRVRRPVSRGPRIPPGYFCIHFRKYPYRNNDRSDSDAMSNSVCCSTASPNIRYCDAAARRPHAAGVLSNSRLSLPRTSLSLPYVSLAFSLSLDMCVMKREVCVCVRCVLVVRVWVRYDCHRRFGGHLIANISFRDLLMVFFLPLPCSFFYLNSPRSDSAGTVCLWDPASSSSSPVLDIRAYISPAVSVCWSPSEENSYSLYPHAHSHTYLSPHLRRSLAFATASLESIKLWDRRNPWEPALEIPARGALHRPFVC